MRFFVSFLFGLLAEVATGLVIAAGVAMTRGMGHGLSVVAATMGTHDGKSAGFDGIPPGAVAGVAAQRRAGGSA